MRKAALALLLGVVCSPGAWAAGAEVPGPAGSPVETEEEDQEEDVDEDEEEDLRERLTEREDKRRPERSWSIPLADRPLTISGEVELEPRFVRRRVLDPERPDPTDPEFERDRLLTETGIEVEAFYTFGPVLSLFAQVRLTSERDLIDGVEDEVSDLYLEPGEIWLFSEDIAGTGLNFDAGRLDFEDERRWWWDDELDAARLAYEADALEISLAAVRPLLPDRTDQSYVEPERDRVFRLIGQASWDFRPNHGFELFAVHHDDRSSTERIGAVVKDELEDESDARLRWLGARAMGVFDLRPRGTLGYWLDLAWLRGKERFIEYDDDPALPRRSDAVEVIRRHVHGSAYDAGVSYAFTSVAGEPRLFGRHARGSRDFRQTDLEANEAGFGGVERFPHYGALPIRSSRT